MLRSAAVALLFTLVLAPTAAARTIDLPDRLNPVLGEARDAGLVVLFPSRVPLDYGSGPLFAEGVSDTQATAYALTLSATEDCGGATACFLAAFTGERGAPLGGKANVSLALGMRGRYRPLSCGASCSPPSIAWVQKGVRYELQVKALGGKAAFVKMANSAIRHGNRR
jgi:hypothetical protein